VQAVSRRIASAVARVAIDENGLDRIDDEGIQQRIDDIWWKPAYVPIHLAGSNE
jgi:hypothetical protein